VPWCTLVARETCERDLGRLMRNPGATGRLATAGWLGALALVTVLAAGCTSGPPKASASGSSDGAVGAVSTSTTTEAPPPLAQLAIAPADKAADVSPVDAVKVSAAQGTLTSVALANADGKQIKGQLSPDGQTWQSIEPLGYGRSYTVTATATGTDGRPVTSTSSFTTIKPRNQTYASMNPRNGEVVGIGQPIAIYFDEPIKDKATAQKAITIRTTPAVEGAFYWFSDKEVHWRPQKYWAAGTKVVTDIKIYGKDLGGGIYGQEDRHIAFTIGDAFVAEADGNTHQMVVKVNGAVVKTVPISMGREKYPTGDGTFVVTEKFDKKIMDSSTWGIAVDSPDGYKTEVQWATRISGGGVFVHAAPWSLGDQGKRNVSHGCLNASPANAKWFYDTAKKGDIVLVTNSGGPKLAPTDGFGDWNMSWAQWVKGGKK
jgi:lipoprotein-anchoring transpeptidase ErfK/SrfK